MPITSTAAENELLRYHSFLIRLFVLSHGTVGAMSGFQKDKGLAKSDNNKRLGGRKFYRAVTTLRSAIRQNIRYCVENVFTNFSHLNFHLEEPERSKTNG